jgi:hypothetical protein
VDSLSDENVTKQIVAAVLLRRSFDSHTRELTCVTDPGAIDEFVAAMMADRHRDLPWAAGTEQGTFHHTRFQAENELQQG